MGLPDQLTVKPDPNAIVASTAKKSLARSKSDEKESVHGPALVMLPFNFVPVYKISSI